MEEKLSTEDVLRDLGRTNINNIKHNKHINTIKHINTFNDFTSSDNQQMSSLPLASSTSSPFPASQPVEVALASNGCPPSRYLKADLFDNATMQQLAKNKQKLNLKLSFLLHDKPDYQYLAAALNTPWRNVKRGFDLNIPEDLEHYGMLERVYMAMTKMGLERVRASKCYQPAKKGKGPTVYGISVVMGYSAETEHYHLAFVDQTQVYEITLNASGLSDLQRQSNCIASGWQGEMQRTRVSRNTFFGK
jgi:hypothetical protein